jgi:hypothetical protein
VVSEAALSAGRRPWRWQNNYGGSDPGPNHFHHCSPASTIRQTDRIIVLKDRQIAESGTHAELLAQRGIYLRFHELESGSSATTVGTKSE